MEALDEDELEALDRVGIRTALDVLCLTSNELARRLRIPDARHITEKVANALAPSPQLVSGPSHKDSRERISTGDANLDSLIGGGIVTGAIWEIVGESSTGKTQLALQMALMAMVSPSHGTFAHSACYLSNRSSFPTERLVQMLHSRPSLRLLATATESMLELMYFRHLTSSDDLMQLLEFDLLQLAEQKIAAGAPLRLLVVDALAPLVAFEEQATPSLLRDRAQKLNDVGFLLLYLARKYNFAVLVINEVYDVFTRERDRSQFTTWKLPTWDRQADWFSRTPQRLVTSGAVDPNGRKEAKLGLGWAYRAHARIMLTRTNRKWTSPNERPSTERGSEPPIHGTAALDMASCLAPAKKRRLDSPSLPVHALTHVRILPQVVTENNATSPVALTPISLRDLTVLFNKFGPRASVDFVICTSGIKTIDDTSKVEEVTPQVNHYDNFPAGKSALPSDDALPKMLLPKTEPPTSQLMQAAASIPAGHTSTASLKRHSAANSQPEAVQDPSPDPLDLHQKPDTDPVINDVDWEFYFPDIYGQSNNCGVDEFELDFDDAAPDGSVRPPSPTSSRAETEVDDGEMDGKASARESSHALGRAAPLTSARSLPH